MMRTLIVLTSALIVAVVAACSSSPTGRSQLILVGDEEVARTGRLTYQQMKSQIPLSRDPATVAAVNCVAEAIVDAIDADYGPPVWEVTVFDQDAINAFALPGGYIGVFSGIFRVAENQDQLAAVIGHEVAHVIARHANERVSRGTVTQVGGAVIGSATGLGSIASDAAMVAFFLPHTRTQESEADTLGLEYMARAGFDPRAAIDLWENMERENRGGPPEFLSTHPSGATRIAELKEAMPPAFRLYAEAKAAGRVPNCQ